MESDIVLILARVIHAIWKEEKEAEDFHSPRLCPNFEKNEEDEDVNQDLIHCNKCLANLVEFDALSSYHKKLYEEKAIKHLDAFKSHGLELKFI